MSVVAKPDLIEPVRVEVVEYEGAPALRVTCVREYRADEPQVETIPFTAEQAVVIGYALARMGVRIRCLTMDSVARVDIEA